MKDVIEITVIGDDSRFTLVELTRSCQVDQEWVIELVQHGVLDPEGNSPQNWLFKGIDLKRSQKALRLGRELAINASGVALAMDLIEKIETLEQELSWLKRLHDL